MAVNTDDIDLIAARTVDAYREAELHLVTMLRDAIRKEAEGEAAGLAASTQERLTAVLRLRRAAEAVVARLSDHADVAFRAAAQEAYRNGRGGATLNLPAALGDEARAARALVPRVEVVDALASALVRDMGPAHLNILRNVDDVYRQVTTAAAVRSVAGGITRLQASQAAWQGLVDQGVTSFTDRGGRTWQLTSYVEMAIRTLSMRAAVEGQVDRLRAQGIDLVIVSDHGGECVLCRPWENKILSLTGSGARTVFAESLTEDEDDDRTLMTTRPRGLPELVRVDVAGSLIEARAAGFLHPNCEHSVRAYLPGATTIPKGETADPEHNKAKDRQRAIERAIRRHKMRETAALTPEARRAASAKVKQWQAEMRQHLKDHPKLKRLAYREQIGAGNLPPRGGPSGGAAGRLLGPPPKDSGGGGTAGTVEQRAARRAAARERQRQIAAADQVAQLAAEVDEVLGKTSGGAIDDDILSRILQDRLDVAGIDGADLAQLQAAVTARDWIAVRSAAGKLAASKELTPIGRFGDRVTMSDAYQLVEGVTLPDGAQAQIVRQGFTLTMPDGEVIPLDRPVVTPLRARASEPARPVRDIISVRPALQGAETLDDVRAVFLAEARRIMGRDDIDADFAGQHLLTAREHSEGILRVLERYPAAQLRIVGHMPPGWSLFAKRNEDRIEFNDAQAGADKRDAYLSTLADNMFVAAGHRGGVPVTPAEVAIHEMAHIVDMETLDSPIDSQVYELVKEMAAQRGLHGADVLQVVHEISDYAASSAMEAIAEAVTDVIVHGDQAAELSRRIVELLDAEYAAYVARLARPNLPGPTSGGPRSTLAAAVRRELREAATTLDVELTLTREIQRIIGRTVPVNFGPDADADTAREHAEGVLRMLEHYPSMPLSSVDWMDPRPGQGARYAEAEGGIIRFSREWSVATRRADYTASVRQDASGGWHPRGADTPVAIALHEMAHVLHEAAGPDVTRQVRELVRAMANREGVTPEQLIKAQVSEYALKDLDELIAEAVTDVVVNGDAASPLSRAIAAMLDDEVGPGGAPVAGRRASQPAPERYHRVLDGLQDLAELAEQARAHGSWALAGRGVELVTLPDGRQILHERTPGPTAVRQADAKLAVSWLARLLDVQTPRVYRDEPDAVWVEVVDAPTVASQIAAATEDELDLLAIQLQRAVASSAGRRVGLLDLMAAVAGRDSGRWRLHDGVPIVDGHGGAFGPLIQAGPEPPHWTDGDGLLGSSTYGPFARHFADGPGRFPAWAQHEFTLADLFELNRRLTELAPDFDVIGRGAWLRYAQRVILALTPHASGTHDLIEGA